MLDRVQGRVCATALLTWKAFAASREELAAVVHAAGQASSIEFMCWGGGFSRDTCCDQRYGARGKSDCWDATLDYSQCCSYPVYHYLGKLETMLGPIVDALLSRGATGDINTHLVMQSENLALVHLPDAIMAAGIAAVLLTRRGQADAAMVELAKVVANDLSIATSGAFVGAAAAEYHMHDETLSAALVGFFRQRNAQIVADFGCGLGNYVRDLRNAGFQADGFDGNPATVEITEGRCSQVDLSKELDFGMVWDWLMTFEVGEHIPKEFESTFLRNLERHVCEGLIVSWSNMAAEFHVNLRNRSEVTKMFAANGFKLEVAGTRLLREAATLHWMQDNLFVFERVRWLGTPANVREQQMRCRALAADRPEAQEIGRAHV